MNPNALWLHIISVIVHCIIIVSIVVAVCVLASDRQLTPDALGLLGTLGGGTVVSLGINGRKIPAQPHYESGQWSTKPPHTNGDNDS